MLTPAEARDKWAGIANEDIKNALPLSTFLTNRDYEGEVGDNTKSLRLVWPTTAFTKPTVNTTRDLVVPNHAGSDVAEVTLEVNRSFSFSEYERELDILEGPTTILPTVMRDVNRVVAEAVEEDVRDAWIAGLKTANDGNSTAGLRYGTATQYIDQSGEASGAAGSADRMAALRFLPTLFRRVGSTFRGRHGWKLGDPAYEARRPYMLMDNGLWTGFEQYVDEDEAVTDTLKDEFTRSDGVEVGGLVGVWKDIPAIVAADLPLIELSSKDYHQVLSTNPAAMTLAMKTPVLEIDTGLVLRKSAGTVDMAEGFTVYRRVTMGRQVKNADYMYRHLVRAEA